MNCLTIFIAAVKRLTDAYSASLYVDSRVITAVGANVDVLLAHTSSIWSKVRE
jgi:hypothetical protein